MTVISLSHIYSLRNPFGYKIYVKAIIEYKVLTIKMHHMRFIVIFFLTASTFFKWKDWALLPASPDVEKQNKMATIHSNLFHDRPMNKPHS